MDAYVLSLYSDPCESIHTAWSIQLANPPYAGVRYGIGVFVQYRCISVAYLDSSLVIVALDGRDVVADGAM